MPREETGEELNLKLIEKINILNINKIKTNWTNLKKIS
jgi:hypothetical protein